MRVAAVGDIHCKKGSQGVFQALFGAMAAAADVLALCGDLTDYGLAEEARVLVKEMGAAKTTPIVAVLGNHDYESGEVDQVKAILGDAGVIVLDGDAHEINGVGFAVPRDWEADSERERFSHGGRTSSSGSYGRRSTRLSSSSRPSPSSAPPSASLFSTTRPSARRSRGSRTRSSRSSGRAGWKSLSSAIR